MVIRAGTLHDHTSLMRLATRMIETSPYGVLFPIDPGQLGQLGAWMLAEQCVLFAQVHGEDVGVVAGIASEHVWSGITVLEEAMWYVDPAHRGGRVGPRLLRAFEAWALEKRCAMVKMVAPQASTVGAHLERLGYSGLETAFVKDLRTLR